MRSLLLVGVAACGRIDFDPGVMLDSSGVNVVTATGVSSLELSTLQVGDGFDECLVAGLVLGNETAANVTLAWNEAPLTPIATESTTGPRGLVVAARLIAPDRGLHALTASWTGSSDAILAGVSFAGADQSECARETGVATGVGAMPSIAIASAPGEMTLDVSATTSAFVAATQTARAIALAGSEPRLVQQVTHTALSVSTDTCTLDALPTAGNNLVFVGSNVAGGLVSVTGGGVTWQYATRSDMHSNVEIWYGEATTGGSAQITYSGVAASSMMCWVGELSGLASASSLDATNAVTGDTSPSSPGELATTHPDEVLILGSSTHAVATWGAPAPGTWVALPEIDNSSYSQTEFIQQVAVPGMWNPSIAEASTTDPSWDSVIAGFTATAVEIGGALSTGPGGTTNTHAWSTNGAGFWASVGVDVFP